MRRIVLAVVSVVAAACGGLEQEPADQLVATGTADLGGMLPDGGWTDPCSLVNGRNHLNVVNTVTAIDNSDSRCMPPQYETLGQVTIDSFPVSDNRFGPCPITYAQTTRQAPDGGLEPACHTTASCSLQFNGGASAVQSFDFTWTVNGTYSGWFDQTSTGQLCPYVRVTSDNTGGL